jgi:hypothetical protein
MWWETDRRELVLAQLLCLDATGDVPRLSKCHEMAGLQEWQHPNQVGLLYIFQVLLRLSVLMTACYR